MRRMNEVAVEQGVWSMASIDFVIRARHWHYIGDSVCFFFFFLIPLGMGFGCIYVTWLMSW